MSDTGDTNFKPSLCIICQENKKCAPGNATEKGVNGLIRSCEARKKKYDEPFKFAINRIDSHVINVNNVDNVQSEVKYHIDCYATFTSNTHISRLRERVVEQPNLDLNGNHDLRPSTNPNLDENDNESTGDVDWTKCIFCQKTTKEHLRKVVSDTMATTITHFGSVSDELNHRILSATTDLTQCGTSYHTNCFIKNKRLFEKLSAPKDKQCLALSQLISQLRVAANQGKVLKLADVYDKFLQLAEENGETVPRSFESRRSTFKEKLSKELHDVYQFYQPLDRDIHERQMLMIPIKFQNRIIANQVLNEEEDVISSFAPEEDDINRAIIYSALKVHNDLKEKPGHKGLNVSLDSSKAVIPDRLNMWLAIACDGLEGLEKLLDNDKSASQIESESDDDESDDETVNDCDEKETVTGFEKKILSIAQDIVYVASRGKKITPKHIGLAVSLNRSKKLITLFNRAGHCLSYRQMLQVDTALAEKTLDSLDYTTGAVTPPNILPYQQNSEADDQQTPCPFLHVTADNIDKQTDTLDGKNSFHATQMVVFQRGGKPIDSVLDSLKVTQKLSIQVPEILGHVFDPDVPPREEPVLNNSAELSWYRREKPSDSVVKAEGKDMAFIVGRQFESIENRTGWTEHNKILSTKNPSITSYGFMPLILNPAHEYKTLQTVLMRCVSLADSLHYPYIDLVVDQALFCKLLELRWSSDIFQKRIILRMGGVILGKIVNNTRPYCTAVSEELNIIY